MVAAAVSSESKSSKRLKRKANGPDLVVAAGAAAWTVLSAAAGATAAGVVAAGVTTAGGVVSATGAAAGVVAAGKTIFGVVGFAAKVCALGLGAVTVSITVTIALFSARPTGKAATFARRPATSERTKNSSNCISNSQTKKGIEVLLKS